MVAKDNTNILFSKAKPPLSQTEDMLQGSGNFLSDILEKTFLFLKTFHSYNLEEPWDLLFKHKHKYSLSYIKQLLVYSWKKYNEPHTVSVVKYLIYLKETPLKL